MRKVLFLDIDGVLNPKWWDRKKHVDIYGGAFDPKAVANLAQIIEKTGAEIVISSSWKELGLSELRNMWKERKLPGMIIDVTPDYMTDEMLLNADLNDSDIDHLYIRGCDMDDVIPEQQSHLVQTDPNIGISDWDAIMAIMILNNL